MKPQMLQTMIDERGHIYGRLTVLEFAGADRHRKIIWLCECSCGETKIVCGCSLRNGRTTSCGCYRRENGHRSLETLWAAYSRKFPQARAHVRLLSPESHGMAL